MDENENDQVFEDSIEEVEETTEEEVVEEKPEQKVQKPKESPEAKKARLERELKQLNKKLGVVEEEPARAPSKKNTGELDDTQLDYLDLKGISDQDDIDLIQKVMTKTGQSLREVLKDDYVQSKLEAAKQERAVKDATPSGTKRGGNQQSDASAIIARFEATGEMPDDFASREKVVEYLVKKDHHNAPSWHK